VFKVCKSKPKEPSTLEPSTPWEYEFELHCATDPPIVNLIAASNEERQQWLDALEQIIDARNQPSEWQKSTIGNNNNDNNTQQHQPGRGTVWSNSRPSGTRKDMGFLERRKKGSAGEFDQAPRKDSASGKSSSVLVRGETREGGDEEEDIEANQSAASSLERHLALYLSGFGAPSKTEYLLSPRGGSPKQQRKKTREQQSPRLGDRGANRVNGGSSSGSEGEGGSCDPGSKEKLGPESIKDTPDTTTTTTTTTTGTTQQEFLARRKMSAGTEVVPSKQGAWTKETIDVPSVGGYLAIKTDVDMLKTKIEKRILREEAYAEKLERRKSDRMLPGNGIVHTTTTTTTTSTAEQEGGKNELRDTQRRLERLRNALFCLNNINLDL